jgi:hypothetical protein
VREEVRFLIDTFDRSEGGMCIAADRITVADGATVGREWHCGRDTV